MKSLSLAFPLLLLLFLPGCLPSCQRTQTKALFPADSLSRQVAQQVPVDTLRRMTQTAGAAPHELAYPRTVRYSEDGRLYVSDVKRNSLFIFQEDGTFITETSPAAFSYPYLAGLRGDTALVFSPEEARMDFVTDGAIARSVTLTAEKDGEASLRYAAATDSALYFKALSEKVPSYLTRLNDRGQVKARHPLPGPYWRHAGLLRPWGDSLLSLSGYRPVVDVLSGGTLDTLALSGFDSPMLARSRAFITGDADKPPLLTASAAPTANHLFVLNMRPGWLRVDVYDRDGRLERVLVERRPKAGTEFYPMDLAVRRTNAGRYELAVVAAQPTPQLTVYRWTPHKGPA